MDFAKNKRVMTVGIVLAFAGVALTGCLGGDPGEGEGGEPLRIGTILPLTGALEAFGPGMENGVKLAVKQINEAGGVNGQDVELYHEDSRTDPGQAPSAFNNLVNNNVHGVVGAASSGVTATLLDLAVQNQIALVSPASTSPSLTEGDNQGWFYRVPPNDALQGQVLAQLVYDEGHQTVSILAVNNPYGVGLGDVFQQTFEDLGGTVQQYVRFEEEGSTYASQVQQAAQNNPSAIVLVGYPGEGQQIMREAHESGIMEQSTFYFSEGVRDPEFIELVGNRDDGTPILAGLKGTTPEDVETSARSEFVEAYQAEYGEEPGLFAAESFDAAWAIALAAQRGGENSGQAVRDNMLEIYNIPGTDYSGGSAQDALDAAGNGEDINYVGAANDFDWDEKGDPTSGIYAIWQVAEDGSIETTESGIQATAEGA